MAVQVDLEKCTGCGTCVDACPSEALSMGDEKVVVDEDACIDCAACVDECPVEALAMD
jgi:NAD-dependent dihydropyrimidine dehydrogenase PreA subunit